MTTFTPGPWTATWDDNGFYAVIADGMPSPYIVATGSDGEPNESNARLIAAAPTLLAVAQSVIDELEYYIGNPSAWESYSENVSEQMRRVHVQARAALARATTTR